MTSQLVYLCFYTLNGCTVNIQIIHSRFCIDLLTSNDLLVSGASVLHFERNVKMTFFDVQYSHPGKLTSRRNKVPFPSSSRGHSWFTVAAMGFPRLILNWRQFKKKNNDLSIVSRHRSNHAKLFISRMYGFLSRLWINYKVMQMETPEPVFHWNRHAHIDIRIFSTDVLYFGTFFLFYYFLKGTIKEKNNNLIHICRENWKLCVASYMTTEE